jgi:hypothetical protein
MSLLRVRWCAPCRAAQSRRAPHAPSPPPPAARRDAARHTTALSLQLAPIGRGGRATFQLDRRGLAFGCAGAVIGSAIVGTAWAGALPSCLPTCLDAQRGTPLRAPVLGCRVRLIAGTTMRVEIEQQQGRRRVIRVLEADISTALSGEPAPVFRKLKNSN